MNMSFVNANRASVALALATSLLVATGTTAVASEYGDQRSWIWQYDGTGTAEIVLTPELPDGFAITGASDQDHAMVVTLPISGHVRIAELEGVNELTSVAGAISAPGTALTLFARDLDIELDYLEIGFSREGQGAILYGSEFGPRYGRPVFSLGTSTTEVDRDGNVHIEAPVFFNEDFAKGVGIDQESALVGTIRLALFDTEVSEIDVIDRDDLVSPGDQTMVAAGNGPGGGPSGILGADVFTLEVGGTFGRYGTVGDITGYAVSTTSCNQGDEWAIWLPNANRHPLIAQNVFRSYNGRFEQIGMSWLKHAWCAADFFGCAGGGSANGTCSYMTIGIADVYDAVLNADQQDLGPRSEVNAATGEYPYPYLLFWNQTGDGAFKRLQLDINDLEFGTGQDNSDVRYVVEVYYVTTDEAPNDMDAQYNNASWRRALRANSPSGGGYNMFFSSTPTITEQTAVEAWSEFVITPDPYLPGSNHVDIEGEQFTMGIKTGDPAPPGRVIVGYNATPLPDGMWAYDYTVYNYNSHRSINSFTVPIPGEETSSAMSHHYPKYHSGEPHLEAAWNIVETPGLDVTWSTDTFSGTAAAGGNEQSANVIRWSTAHSFHMESTYPPGPINATLGVFRPGTPSSVQIQIDGPSPDCNNNEVADAIDISSQQSTDFDENGIPDDCQPCVMVFDMNAVGPHELFASVEGTPTESVALKILGDSENPDVSCLDTYVQADGTLDDTPFFQTIADWDTFVTISDTEIIPEATYTFVVEPENAASECDGAPIESTTLIWADANINGVTNLEDAFLAILDFQFGLYTPSADVEPCGGNGLINLGDVLVIVLAWQGNETYVDICGGPCP